LNKDGITAIGAEISDFNNDGFQDFNYRSGVAAKGGNIIRTLLMYDPKNIDFIDVNNSDQYLILRFNSN